MNNIYHNYELDYLGHSLIVTNDKGIIVETAIPFHKYRGKSVDCLVNELKDRPAFHGLKDLGKTVNGILKSVGDA